MSPWQLLRGVRLSDWLIEAVVPSVVLGWGVWLRSWLGIWLGLCGLLCFLLRSVYYPKRGRSQAESWRLLPGVGALCVCGVFAGLAWVLLGDGGAPDGVILGLFFAVSAVPLGFAAAVFLRTPFARRFGMGPDSPAVDVDPTQWPDPPPYSG